jgi:putative protease
MEQPIRQAVNKPKLLSPAGDFEKLKMAVLYGADAVYLAGQSFGMRSFAGNFTAEELPRAVRFAHERGVRVHVTVNTMPRNQEAHALPAYLELLDSSGVDALILADLGAFTMAKKYAPHCERHISTQQSVANDICATAWYELGAKCVVLARELSLDEIREIRARTPRELELECFCHGAMCVSYSGRCVLSNYMTGRDATRGECAQPCRYQYALMEEKRPGEYFPVFEDEKGSYILNSRDMCMIDHLWELGEAGVDCLKIEGRAKSAYYAAVVTGAYRHCLDDACAGRPLDDVWRDEVEHISHRHYSTGFYYGPPGQYTADSRYLRNWQVLAIVESCDDQGSAVLSLRNKFSAGDPVEAVGPDCRPFSFDVPLMRDAGGLELREPRTPQMRFFMKLPKQVPPYSILRRAADIQSDNDMRQI